MQLVSMFVAKPAEGRTLDKDFFFFSFKIVSVCMLFFQPEK